MKYLIIMDDGTVYKTDEITASDMDYCDNGSLTIIDISAMTEYWEGCWIDIEKWEAI